MKLFLVLILLTFQVQAQDYNRSAWKHWLDFDGDCQNTRHELLIQRSQTLVGMQNRCSVASGTWVDPYTGQTFTNSKDLDVDHVIPLGYAHRHGGSEWSPLVKKLFANDPENLEVVSLRENRKKGDSGPGEYLPPQGRCEYVRKWKHMASKYELILAQVDLMALRC